MCCVTEWLTWFSQMFYSNYPILIKLQIINIIICLKYSKFILRLFCRSRSLKMAALTTLGRLGECLVSRRSFNLFVYLKTTRNFLKTKRSWMKLYQYILLQTKSWTIFVTGTHRTKSKWYGLVKKAFLKLVVTKCSDLSARPSVAFQLSLTNTILFKLRLVMRAV